MSTASDSWLCPVCHAEKHPGQGTCSNCGVKSCPNAHVFSPDLTKCPQCGWEEHGWKAAREVSPNETTDTGRTEGHDSREIHICPKCYTELDGKYGRCPHCGYLSSL